MLLSGLNVTAWTILLRMMCYIVMCGILRPGGDTKYPMILDIVVNWAVIIPAMFAAVLLLHSGLAAAMFICYLGEGIKWLFCYLRYRSGAWLNVLTGVESLQ